MYVNTTNQKPKLKMHSYTAPKHQNSLIMGVQMNLGKECESGMWGGGGGLIVIDDGLIKE